MSETTSERARILPGNPDTETWSPKQKIAHAWLVDRVAMGPINETLAGLDLADDVEVEIRSAAGAGRIAFIDYIQELTGESLSSEEFVQVLGEINEAEQRIAAEDAKKGA